MWNRRLFLEVRVSALQDMWQEVNGKFFYHNIFHCKAVLMKEESKCSLYIQMSITFEPLISCFIIQKYSKVKILILCSQSIKNLKQFNKLECHFGFQCWYEKNRQVVTFKCICSKGWCEECNMVTSSFHQNIFKEGEMKI